MMANDSGCSGALSWQHGDWRSLAVLEYNETSWADRQLVPLVVWRARSRHVPRDLSLGRLHCELVGCLPSPVQWSPGLRWCLGVTATQ